jgi:hypothetical protein
MRHYNKKGPVWVWVIATEQGEIITKDKGIIKESISYFLCKRPYSVLAHHLHDTTKKNQVEQTLHLIIKSKPINYEWTDLDVLFTIKPIVPK